MKKVFIAMCLAFVGLCVSAKGMNGNSFEMNSIGVQGVACCYSEKSLLNSGVVGVPIGGLASSDSEAFVGNKSNFPHKSAGPVRSGAAIDYGIQIKNVRVLDLGGKCGEPFHVVGMFVVNSLVELVDACLRDFIPSENEVPELLLFSLNTFLLMMILTMTVV